MLQLDLRPGDGLGPFKLGASLWSIIALVRQPHSKTLFPSVKVIYDTSGPATSVIIVHLHPYIDLLFSGKGQRLHTIALRHLRHGLPTSPKQAPQSLAVGSAASSNNSRGGSSLILRYKHATISSPDEVLRRAGVMKSFGPTYEGDIMKYPGVSFVFEDDAAALMRSPRLGSADENKRVEVKKITVTQRTAGGDDVDAFDEVLECPVMDGDLRSVVLRVHEGIDLYFYPSTSSSSSLRLGEATAEDIRHELGEPMNIYYKEDDRIAIHGSSTRDETSANSYFMNYFQYGIDFFMDGTTHILKKIILHSNVVGSPHFQRYQRCPWEIADPSQSSKKSPVTCVDSLEDIKSFLSRYSTASQPMELDRSEDYEALSIPSSFTRLIGFDGVILEATASGQVGTVTLY